MLNSIGSVDIILTCEKRESVRENDVNRANSIQNDKSRTHTLTS